MALFRRATINSALALALAAYVIYWFIIPAISLLLFPYDEISFPPYRAFVDVTSFSVVYITECIALWIVIFGFILNSRRQTQSTMNPQAAEPSGAIIIAVLIVFVTISAYNVSTTSMNYVERNSAANYGAEGVTAVILIFLSSALTAIAIRRPKWSFLSIISILALTADAALAAMRGARFYLLVPFLLIAFKSIRRRNINLQLVALSAAGILVTFYLILPAASVLSAARQKGEINIASAFSSGGMAAEQQKLFSELFTKLDSFSASVVLLQDAAHTTGYGNGGWWTPYLGSLTVFLPRAIWPDRPVAGSADGTIYGHPSRVVGRLVLPGSDSINVGVSPAAIAMWQFGQFGILIFVGSAILFLSLINSLMNSSSFAKAVAGAYLLSIPTFAFLLPSPDVMLMRTVVAMAYLAIATIIFPLRIKKFTPGQLALGRNGANSLKMSSGAGKNYPAP
jgi:hypothetical protein